MERISIDRPNGASHLGVILDAPASPRGVVAILYMHGFGSVQSGEKATFFRRRAREAGVAFCSFDFEGHGESGGTMRELTLSRNLENIATVRTWLAGRGFERVVLFGSSMGGAAALWFAADHPKEVAAAIAIAPSVGLLNGLESWAGAAGLAEWERTGVRRFRNEHVDADLGWELVADLRRHDFEALARRATTPTLVFQGRKDAIVDWRDVARFASNCAPGTIDLRLFPDGDHRLTDRKDLLWSESHQFLSRQGLLS